MSTEEKLVHALKERNLTLATCESCTGGMLGEKITSVPGASEVYVGGFITYTSEMKNRLAGVGGETLEKYGAVSSEAAHEMAEGTAKKTGADCAISVTGNAGPDPSEGKPVGLVYLGFYLRGRVYVQECHFEGDRAGIRTQAAEKALEIMCRAVES